jgi:hypothetical protein
MIQFEATIEICEIASLDDLRAWDLELRTHQGTLATNRLDHVTFARRLAFRP